MIYTYCITWEKVLNKQIYKKFEPRSWHSYCNACTFQYNEHLSPVDPKSTNASKVQQQNNNDNNKKISQYTMAHREG